MGVHSPTTKKQQFGRNFRRKLVLVFFVVFLCFQGFFLQKYITTSSILKASEQNQNIGLRKNLYSPLGGLQSENKSSKYKKIIDPNRILSFQTGDSFVQQRIGLINSVIFSMVQQRTIFLRKNMFCLGQQKNCDDFFYDRENFSSVLKQNNIAFKLLDNQNENLDLENSQIESEQQFQCSHSFKKSCFQELQDLKQSSKLNIQFPEIIPIPPEIAKENKILIKQLFEGLILTQKYEKIKQKVVSRIQFICRSQNFSTIYINKTATNSDVIPYLEGNNQLTSTYAQHVSAQLQIKEFEQNIPLFIWGNDLNIWESQSLNQLISGLKKNSREFVLENPIYSDFELSKQFLTAINFYVSLDAHRTFGDGSNILTQLLILERQLRGKWASYFNHELLQLQQIYPIFDVPWIFTHNAWSSNVDYLVKVAVRSAVQIGGVKPYCLFSGEKNSEIGKWLEKMGVKLIFHEPQWMSHLVMKNSKAKEYKDSHSHLYGTAEGIIGTFLRIDIPVLGDLSQYPYVLFTDTDIYFRKNFNFWDLPQPLPLSIGMGGEVFPQFPYNAGISIMNMFNLRLNYDKFLKFILDNQQALFFPGYGPGDQGAFNQFYENTVRKWYLPEIFNTKPYKKFNNNSVIVHFHGPKPYDYFEYITTGYCRPILDQLCIWAVQNGMCQYVQEWANFSEEDEIGKKLSEACRQKQQIKQQNQLNSVI